MSFLITDDNFDVYAMKAYRTPCLSTKDYYNDLKKINYIIRLINRYKTRGILKERLILNHIIELSNVFGIDDCVRILMFKIEPKHWSELTAFLFYLNFLKNEVKYIKEHPIKVEHIPMNMEVLEVLKRL